MDRFVMNGIAWCVKYVNPGDDVLIDRTGSRTVATTDPVARTVYLSNELSGDFLYRVVIHEMGHCAMFAFGLLDEIHKMTRIEYWIAMEEFICNFIADYGYYIFEIAYKILGVNAMKVIPYYIEKLVS